MYTHDPGLTLNDILNYLLADLKYKLDFDLEDYLRTEGNPLDAGQIGIEKKLLTTLPTTVNARDFEALMVNRIPGVVQVELNRSTGKKHLGCYQVHALISVDVPPNEEGRIRQEIREQFYRHRNLCEDLEKITLSRSEKNLPNPAKKDNGALTIDDEHQPYTAGTYRNVYEHIPARMDFPDFYGINDWGLPEESEKRRKIQAEQLKAYLSLFDKVIETGLAELKMLPRIIRLDEDIVLPEKAKLKEQFLNNLDKIYGVNSRPDFMLTTEGRTETPEESITRRVRFLGNIHLWGKHRNKAALLNREKMIFGMEAYLQGLFDLKEGENIRLIEHTFFRHIPERIRSRNDKPENFPYELSLTVFLYGKTKRMRNSGFKKGLKMAVLKQIPAHLEGSVYWIYNEEAGLLDELYRRYTESFRFEEQENGCYRFSIEVAEQLKDFILKKRGQ